MRAEDLIPFLAMIAYIALLVFKRRKRSGSDAKSRVDKKPTRDRTQNNLWDMIQGKTQDKIQGQSQQEESRAAFRGSSKDRGRGEASPMAAGLFSKLGERLRVFFSELEQQFRMEAEKARMKDQIDGQVGQVGQVRNRESDKSHAAEQEVPAYFDHVDFDAPAFTLQEENDYEEDTRPIKAGKTPTAARAKKQAPGQRVIKEPLRPHHPGVNLSLSSDEIRTAVVWSEILAPPLALRTGKRPWEN